MKTKQPNAPESPTLNFSSDNSRSDGFWELAVLSVLADLSAVADIVNWKLMNIRDSVDRF